MAMTNCPDCGREISARADACPGCGAPMRAVSVAAGRHVVIERTGRRWKAMSVWAVLFGCVGFLVCATPALPLGVLLIAIAIPLFIVSRIGRWWTNA